MGEVVLDCRRCGNKEEFAASLWNEQNYKLKDVTEEKKKETEEFFDWGVLMEKSCHTCRKTLNKHDREIL